GVRLTSAKHPENNNTFFGELKILNSGCQADGPPVESCRIFQRYFQYYKSTWLQGPNADILSVNGVIWRTNNVLEVSHQHLRLHMRNMHQPEPWVFKHRKCLTKKYNLPEGLNTYLSGILADYNLAIDDIQVRELQRQILIDHQRNLNLASRLLAEGHTCTKQVTLNFGVVRPMHISQPFPLSEIQPVVENRQPVNAREFILERWPIVDREINILHLIHGIDDEEEEENIPSPVLSNNTYISFEDLTIEPIISESCYTCHYSTHNLTLQLIVILLNYMGTYSCRLIYTENIAVDNVLRYSGYTYHNDIIELRGAKSTLAYWRPTL
ncbi:MULE domain-containing protein, partial [Aphis craccivora]